MKILTLNCLLGLNPDLFPYLENILQKREYDFLLFQEANKKVRLKLEKITANNQYNILKQTTSNEKDFVAVFILYKKEFTLQEKIYFSFNHFPRAWLSSETGLLAGEFVIHKSSTKKITIATTHLHALASKETRLGEVKFINEKLISNNKDGLVILGGDFNNTGKNEIENMDVALEDNFKRIPYNSSYTYDSRLIRFNNIGAVFIKILSYIGFRYKLKLDHFYVSKAWPETFKANTKVLHLETAISDHSPVEMEVVI